MNVTPNYDLSLDYSPIIGTISSSAIHTETASRLQNKRRNWEDYRTKVEEKIDMSISLKNCDETEKKLTSETLQ